MRAIIRRLRKLEDAITPEVREPITVELQFVDVTGAVVDTEYFQLPSERVRPPWHRPTRATESTLRHKR